MPDTFVEYLILILIALLFGKDTLLPPLLKQLGLNGKGKKEETPEWAKDLQLHYNHETTAKLDRIVEAIAKMAQANADMWTKFIEWTGDREDRHRADLRKCQENFQDMVRNFERDICKRL